MSPSHTKKSSGRRYRYYVSQALLQNARARAGTVSRIPAEAIERLVDTAAIPMLLKLVQAGRLQPAKLVTHRFALADIMKAYDTFGHAAQERALKVVLQAR